FRSQLLPGQSGRCARRRGSRSAHRRGSALQAAAEAGELPEDTRRFLPHAPAIRLWRREAEPLRAVRHHRRSGALRRCRGTRWPVAGLGLLLGQHRRRGSPMIARVIAFATFAAALSTPADAQDFNPAELNLEKMIRCKMEARDYNG